jgi:hypothetical protein
MCIRNISEIPIEKARCKLLLDAFKLCGTGIRDGIGTTEAYSNLDLTNVKYNTFNLPGDKYSYMKVLKLMRLNSVMHSENKISMFLIKYNFESEALKFLILLVHVTAVSQRRYS